MYQTNKSDLTRQKEAEHKNVVTEYFELVKAGEVQGRTAFLRT